MIHTHRRATRTASSSAFQGPVSFHTILFFGTMALLFFTAAAQAQNRGGRGAISAQDIQKLNAGPLNSVSSTGVCPNLVAGSTIAAPADLFSQNGVLEVTLNLQTDVDAAGRQRYCYVTNTGLISPNLRVNPGDTLLIHFYNQIPAGLVPVVPQIMPAMPGMEAMSHGAAGEMAAGVQVALHDTPQSAGSGSGSTPSACNGGTMSASASNLHFHGLNVSPACHSDEVVNTLVQPGQEFDYSVQIPANEPSGLYWYHPHAHGFSEGQVQGGATGAIIVQGIEQANPSLLGLPEQTLVIRDLLVPLSEQNDSNVPAWDLSLDNVPVSFPAYTPAVVPVAPGQQQLWRVLNSAADTILNLQYVVGGTAQTVTVVAIDGVPITGGAGGSAGSIQESSMLLPPGSRVEFVATTPAVGQAAQLVTQYINTGPDGDYDPTRPIADIVASATAPALPVLPLVKLPAGGTAKAKVTRFTGLQQAALASTIPQRTLYFSEQLLDPTDPNSPTSFYITQDGMTPAVYTMGQAPNIVVHSGTVETWVIQNRALEDHIFHIHQIHFQVLAVNGVAVNNPALWDTYDLPYWTGQGAYPSITVAMDFRDPNIVGTFVYHCHILQHEDAGMMGAIEVLPPGAASTAVIASSAASLVPAASATLTASVASTVAGGSTPTGQVQFQSNGLDLGNPANVTNGVATLSVAGSSLQSGANSVQAFYMGDANYAESLSAQTTVTDAPFSLTGSGTTAAIGAAASAPLNLIIASGYTSAVLLTCAMPANLTEAACFINPSSVVGGGPATLTVNTTPVHAFLLDGRPALGVPASMAALSFLLLPFARRKRRFSKLLAMLTIGAFAGLLAATGCAGSAARTDPGTLAGTYNVTVTATGLSAATPYTTSIAVPITVQ